MASIQMLFIVGTFLILEYSDDNQFDVFSSKSFPKGSQVFNITQEQFALRLVFAHLGLHFSDSDASSSLSDWPDSASPRIDSLRALSS